MKKVARILSIDGGGIRGIVPASILAQWETVLGPIASHFHMVAGTSTGGILACALTKPSPMKAQALVDFYTKNGPVIFDSQWTALGGGTGSKYPREPIETSIKQALFPGLLSDATNDLLITTYDLEKRLPYLFKSWKARGIEVQKPEKPSTSDFALIDVARATSAAPTFFEPALIKNVNGTSYAMVDGGVYANNPAMCAYVAARRLYPLADEYFVVSIGTGSLVNPLKYDDAKDWGLIGWALPLLNIMFDGSDSTTNYELDQLAPEVAHYRFQTSLVGASEDMDNVTAENLAALRQVSRNTLGKYKKEMGNVMGILKGPMTDKTDMGYPKAGEVNLPKQVRLKPSPVLKANPKIVIPAKKTVDNSASAVGLIGGAAIGGTIGGPIGAVIGAGFGLAAGIFAKKEEERNV